MRKMRNVVPVDRSACLVEHSKASNAPSLSFLHSSQFHVSFRPMPHAQVHRSQVRGHPQAPALKNLIVLSCDSDQPYDKKMRSMACLPGVGSSCCSLHLATENAAPVHFPQPFYSYLLLLLYSLTLTLALSVLLSLLKTSRRHRKLALNAPIVIFSKIFRSEITYQESCITPLPFAKFPLPSYFFIAVFQHSKIPMSPTFHNSLCHVSSSSPPLHDCTPLTFTPPLHLVPGTSYFILEKGIVRWPLGCAYQATK
mmetsp:Transcript_34478/g.89303  ORF Transcript_34478/g.89303 Transcript_34478/m.89303 type:complete len:254 (-) Transcript_34478:1667-2428(-)